VGALMSESDACSSVVVSGWLRRSLGDLTFGQLRHMLCNSERCGETGRFDAE
jgi:hypothetical protein